MTDIIIPLGSGSPWQNNELRYALRSIEKHLHGYGIVYIIGDKPGWITGVKNLQFKEVSLAVRKEKNICMKVMEACLQQELSQEFIFMNDDHFFLNDVQASELPYYYDGTIEERKHGVNEYNVYLKTIKNTVKLIGTDALNYDVHCPVRFNQSVFLHIMNRVNWQQPYGYLMKSLYCNGLSVTGTAMADMKINSRMNAADIWNVIDGRPWFSVGNAGLNDHVKEVLQSLYPKPSCFEII
jgi:hypothetical protein